MKSRRLLVPVSILLLVAGARPAHAYLDPGNGSMILELLLGGVAGLVVIARFAWRRLMAFFGLRRAKSDGDPGAESEDPSGESR